jgi:hypothetical protein
MENTDAQDISAIRVDLERRNESGFDEASVPFLPFSTQGGIHNKSPGLASRRWTKGLQPFRVFLPSAPSTRFVKN